ncbi:MAG: nitrogen fixation protein [Vulcanococcus sp.]
MSWCELERLVQEAESQPPIRQTLRGCGDDAELLLRARRLGYRITRVDLQRAWIEHQQEVLRTTEARKARRASC